MVVDLEAVTVEGVLAFLAGDILNDNVQRLGRSVVSLRLAGTG